ncbi:Fcf1 domain containing protein [Amanita muscaria]
MRQKRAKTYRKLMHLYTLTFQFREPYQVLVDSTMCKTAVELKYDLVKQLGVALQGEVKPMITQCCIHELYLQGRTMQPVVDLAKTFERRKCNHREAIPGDDCILSVVGEGNKHRYIVASQSHPLRVKLRDVPGVPLLHINRAVLILEPPSDATLKAKEAAVGKALHAPAHELPLLEPSIHQDPPRKKKKGPKGPNPLSVKKKKIKPAATPEITAKVTAKRKRDGGDSGNDAPESSNPATTQRKRRRKSHGGILETSV